MFNKVKSRSAHMKSHRPMEQQNGDGLTTNNKKGKAANNNNLMTLNSRASHLNTGNEINSNFCSSLHMNHPNIIHAPTAPIPVSSPVIFNKNLEDSFLMKSLEARPPQILVNDGSNRSHDT